MTAGQVSDHIGARALHSGIPDVDWLLGPSCDLGSRKALPGRDARSCSAA